MYNRYQLLVHERHDKTHCRFTIQLTEHKLKHNKKHLRRNTATPPAIVYYFHLNKRDKTNITKRRRKTTLRFPNRIFPDFSDNRKTTYYYNNFLLTKKTLQKNKGDSKQQLAYLKTLNNYKPFRQPQNDFLL